MREILISALAKELLGPRNGPTEILNDSPLGEYVTGVLAPAAGAIEPDIDAEADLPTEDTQEKDEEGSHDADVGVVAPVLSPKDRPRSVGLSFVTRGSAAAPVFDICLTWARYTFMQRETGAAQWQRQPRFSVLRGVVANEHTFWLNGNGEIVAPHLAEASLNVFSMPSRRAGETLVSLYFVSRLQVAPDEFATAEHHLYQPQIRVRCVADTEIIPGIEGEPRSEEDRRLRFLYRTRPVLARGHICSAVWRAIDPQRAPTAVPDLDYPDAAESPPFAWVDRQQLEEPEASYFSDADVRTEFFPLFPIQGPELELEPSDRAQPELRTSVLAEAYDVRVLEDALQPLLLRYEDWIGRLETDAAALTGTDRVIADGLVDRCKIAARRISVGIGVLLADDNARLSFCFAMQAIALQSTWPNPVGRPPLTLRPFQLAFILTTLESLVNPTSADRDVADLLWVPTGGGKTEAYLALAAFTFALRRLRALSGAEDDRSGAGVAVLTRYTLRLLTIQQFRRTLKMVTACEFLRVDGLGNGPRVGWRPRAYQGDESFLWGSTRFSAGLWVGGAVTPNRLQDLITPNVQVRGALTLLGRHFTDAGEPAQVLRCPACDAVLSVPQAEAGGLPPGRYELHLIVRGPPPHCANLVGLASDPLDVDGAASVAIPGTGTSILSITITSQSYVTAEDVDRLWDVLRQELGEIALLCARPSRPGYFFRRYDSRNGPKVYDFEIICPAPDCHLSTNWCEGTPAGCTNNAAPGATGPRGDVLNIPALPDGNRLVHVGEPFRIAAHFLASRVPIPAWTVDEQVYNRCPSITIATVDKFARPAFKPAAASLFGNVDHHHCMHGFYRAGVGTDSAQTDGAGHPTPAGRHQANVVAVPPLNPPNLIIQDELHLVDGPLGSLVGIYETAVDELCRDEHRHQVKYVASTATVRQAEEQVKAVFARRLMIFPPPGLTVDDSFFIRQPSGHALADADPGRLYVGICAPGRGPLTPLVRIWARILQTAFEQRQHPRSDPYWTLVGYFNAVRELAGGRALYRQDIPERLRKLAHAGARPIPDEQSRELSGRMDSTQLPVVLDLLAKPFGLDALFTTSMFGTGVDVTRLGLMMVNGQPKTTSTYIQATGRVGRSQGGAVLVFMRSTRPRDLNHYEFFCGYHVQLHRFVEPVTVMPFAPGAVDRAAGPVGVFILRNHRNTVNRWTDQQDARQMNRVRHTCPDVNALEPLLEDRAMQQPATRRPTPRAVAADVRDGLNRWERVADANPNDLRFVEYAMNAAPAYPVVLGDAEHHHARFDVVYENVPQSLRDIEETCGFQT